ncbi:alcohol dehydrogenase, partial [Salmonella enterica subsp. enterica serovar Typhimurium]
MEPSAHSHRQPRVDSHRVLLQKLGTVAKLAMRQPFVLFKGLTFQKLCLP